jgi:hypothetical protein
VAGEPGALLVTDRVPESLPAAVGLNDTLSVAFWPGFKVVGNVSPLAEKPADADAAEIVSAALPVLLNVTGCEAVVPTATLPKPTLEGLMPNAGCGVVPAPLKAIEIDEFVAVLVTVTLPLAAAAAVGVNVTLNDVDCPPVSVTSPEKPLTVNAVLPLAATCDTEMLDVPVFFNVTVWDGWLPITTFPNAIAEGLAFSAEPAVSPLPVKDKTVGDPGALLTKLMLPLALPPVVGANWTRKLVLWFAVSVKGRVSPDILNAAPERLAAVIVSGPFPEFMTVAFSVAVPPTETLPKARVPGDRVKPGSVPVPSNATETVASDALLVTSMVALRFPACWGANWI